MNPHIKKAEDALHFSEYQSRGLTERRIDAAQAHAQATLALTFAQETANLIAFMGQFEPDYDWLVLANNAPESPEGKRLAMMNAVANQITERLGLA